MDMNAIKTGIFVLILFGFTSCTPYHKVSNKKAVKELETVKYLIYKNYPIPNYFSNKKYTDSIYNEVYSSLLFKKKISRLNLSKEIRNYTSSFEDGHLSVSLSTYDEIYNLAFGKCLPYDINIIDNKLIVERSYAKKSKIVKGDTLCTINGHTATDIVRSMEEKMPTRNNKFSDRIYSAYFPYYLWLVGNVEPPYSIRYLKNNDSINELQKGIKYSKYVKLSYKVLLQYNKTFTKADGRFIFPDNWEAAKRLPKYYCYLDDTVALLRIESFTGDTVQNNFYKKVFRILSKSKINTLFIDIRDNYGGKTRNFESLLSYLSDDTIYQANKVLLKLTEKVQKMALESAEKGDSDLLKKITGYNIGDTLTLLTKKEMAIYKPNNQYLFRGNLYVLVDLSTFSAASGFATIIKNNDMGLIIGEETEGTTNSSSDPIIFKLPYSKSNLSIPSKMVFQAGFNTKCGLMPDIKFDKNYSFMLNRDRFIKELIKSLKKNQ